MEQDRSLVEPWVPYISLILECLQIIPPSEYLMLYRGVRKAISELKGSYKVGEEVQVVVFLIYFDTQ
jgi:hypothetical protein